MIRQSRVSAPSVDNRCQGLIVMRQTLMALILVLGSPWVTLAQDTQPPPHPATVVVQPNPILRLNDVVFRVSFAPSLDPPSNQPVVTYRWGAGFSDGQQGNGLIDASATPAADPQNWDLNMPYHITGAATIGFVCLQARDAAGNLSVEGACSPVSVPARPVAQPNTSTVRLQYDEPTTSDCTDAAGVPIPPPYALGGNCNPVTGDPTTPTCPVLNDLKAVRATFSHPTINSGTPWEMDFVATRVTGGQNVLTSPIVIPSNVGILSVFVQALDTCDNKSKPSPLVSKDLRTTIPFAGSALFDIIP
jgi:hypothetical protein